ncbi:hypothetical protein [Flavobacterium sp. SM2513]|uniref:hypothetical protein n=1 Tax=Flavobacterium sp. SM2513 TaxID=3424766 RepID=UPI003D7FEDE1
MQIYCTFELLIKQMAQKVKTILNNFIKFGLIPVCMLIVVGVHFHHRSKGLSAWKGGAFGMYSTYHPEYSLMYINGVNYRNLIKNDNKKSRALNNYFYYPTKRNLDIVLKSSRQPADTLQIQIWLPNLDAKTSTYSIQLKNEFSYINSN